MSRVLVTGGAGTIGAAIVRRLLADPAYEVRVSDRRTAPQWMREGCEIHTGDLSQLDEACSAAKGCSHAIHLAGVAGGIARRDRLPHTSIETNDGLHGAVVRASLDAGVERFVYVSSAAVFEQAEEFPTAEEHLARCPAPRSAHAFSKLAGEVYCRAAHEEHGLPFTICRPSCVYGPGEPAADEPGSAHVVADLIEKALAGQRPLQVFGSGEQTRAPTFVDDVADGVVAAMSSPAGCNEDFNLTASRELSVAEIATEIWRACGEDPEQLDLEHLPAFSSDVSRLWPSAEKARRLLGWEARTEFRDGVVQTVGWMRKVREQRDRDNAAKAPTRRRRSRVGSAS
jgi:UDP-glucose 4-epimerase